MVREATLADLRELLRMAERFHEISGMPGVFDREHCMEFGGALIEHSGSLAIRSDSGFLFATESGTYYDPHWRVGVEIAWFAEDRTGMLLLKKFIKWAAERELDEVRLSSINALSGDRVQRFVEKMGFKIAEQSYSLRF